LSRGLKIDSSIVRTSLIGSRASVESQLSRFRCQLSQSLVLHALLVSDGAVQDSQSVFDVFQLLLDLALAMNQQFSVVDESLHLVAASLSNVSELRLKGVEHLSLLLDHLELAADGLLQCVDDLLGHLSLDVLSLRLGRVLNVLGSIVGRLLGLRGLLRVSLLAVALLVLSLMVLLSRALLILGLAMLVLPLVGRVVLVGVLLRSSRLQSLLDDVVPVGGWILSLVQKVVGRLDLVKLEVTQGSVDDVIFEVGDHLQDSAHLLIDFGRNGRVGDDVCQSHGIGVTRSDRAGRTSATKSVGIVESLVSDGRNGLLLSGSLGLILLILITGSIL